MSLVMTNKVKVVLIGVGGASCSGKTLLAKNLRNILPNSTIIHQDDFVPPMEQVPYSKQFPDLQDWDDPETCILWPSFRSALLHIKQTGTPPPEHSSHDHLNKQVEIGVNPDIQSVWKDKFAKIAEESEESGVEIRWFIIDGFVLYWDPEVVELLDVKLFLRVPHDTLKSRREERQVYVLQHPDDASANGVWTDPPNYFPKIVWPGYIKSHTHLFSDGDVENGTILDEWSRVPLSIADQAGEGEGNGKGLVALTPGEGEEGMSQGFVDACEGIVDGLQRGVGSLVSF